MQHFPMRILLLFFFSLSFAQAPKVDFIAVSADITLNYEQRSVSGTAIYDFVVLKATDSIFIDAQNMEFASAALDGKPVKFVNTGKKIGLISKFKKGPKTLELQFSAKPKQTLYFVTAGIDEQIWTQGQGKETSHWLPSFDDVNEKLVFSMNISYDSAYQVISNGTLNQKKTIGNQTRWSYGMKNPMSSYLLMLAIGKFENQTLQAKSGIPMELYIEPEDRAKFEPTYRYSQQMFDFLEQEIGVAYPWEIYRQIPVRDFLYGGMENTTATLFTRDYVVDSTGFNDQNYVYVNAHELAHQWFGDLVTAKSGKHHWLQEGFATYYAWLCEREIFGEDFFYHKLYETAETLQKASKSDNIPILNEKASTLSFYQKGAWALHVLRENIGDAAFKKAVKTYLEKHRFQNVDTDDFLNEVAKVSNYDLVSFRKRWLESGVFEIAEALQLLKKGKFVQDYFKVAELSDLPLADKMPALQAALKSSVYFPVKQEVIYQTAKLPFEQREPLLNLAMQSGEVNLRQSVALTLKTFPEEFKPKYETLLDDASYFTQELALSTLCREFPQDCPKYLDRTKNRIGLNDKNIRLLWLTLALKNPGYEPASKEKYYNELVSYANATQEATLRQSALEKLFFLEKGDTNALPLLASALVHHKWQLTKYARDTIRNFLKSKTYREYFEKLLPTLNEAEKFQLQRLLSE